VNNIRERLKRLEKKNKLDLQSPFKTIEKDFPSREAVKEWIIKNQLGRRNLTPEKIAYLMGKEYEEKKKQGERKDLTSAQSGQKLWAKE